MKEYSWIFDALVALGTFLAVLAALFGDWLKHRIFKPGLRLELSNPRGTQTRIAISAPGKDGGGTRTSDSRYYHLRVSNDKRWPQATNVQVFLLQVEEPGPGGTLQVTWTGDIPLVWRHQQIYPLTRTIGAAAECDFFSVTDKWVSTHLAMAPIEFSYLQRREPFTGVVFTVQARSAEVDTPAKRFRVSWDGKWVPGEAEITRHFEIQELTPPHPRSNDFS